MSVSGTLVAPSSATGRYNASEWSGNLEDYRGSQSLAIRDRVDLADNVVMCLLRTDVASSARHLDSPVGRSGLRRPPRFASDSIADGTASCHVWTRQPNCCQQSSHPLRQAHSDRRHNNALVGYQLLWTAATVSEYGLKSNTELIFTSHNGTPVDAITLLHRLVAVT
jgi:hypothetical protein